MPDPISPPSRPAPSLTWPTMDVPPVAKILGVSRATLYAAIQANESPVRVVRVGSRIKVITASVVEALGENPGAVTSRETPTHLPSSEAAPGARTSLGVKCSAAAERSA